MMVMRIAALFATAALAAACAAVPADAAQPAGSAPASVAPGDENCSVTVVFGSYAMGIDRDSFQKVDRYLKRRAPAVHYTATNWGREGERTVCVTTRNGRMTRKVFSDIRGMLPRVSNRGPVELRSDLGQAYQTKSPNERPRRR
jgi:hypothetical protein